MALSWAKTVPPQGPRECRSHDYTALGPPSPHHSHLARAVTSHALLFINTLLLSLLWTTLQFRVLSVLSTLILVK